MVSPVNVPKEKRSKTNSTSGSKKRRGLIAVFFVVIPAIFYFLFFMNANETPKYLEGIWNRSDGVYKIEIKEVQDDGKMEATYFNPGLINVGKSSWREQDGNMLVYVELRDENYPGSIYRLTYDEKTKTLNGTYFQAVTKETFEVYFTREK